MPMRRPGGRLTIGRLMVVVAVSGLVLASGVWLARAGFGQERERLSESHAVQERYYRAKAEWYGGNADPQSRAWANRLARYHAQLRDKYRLLASRPWLVIEPDPPPPD